MLTVTESTDTCMHTLFDVLRLGRNLKGTMKIAMNQMVWQNFCKKLCTMQINEGMMIGLPNWTPIPSCMHIRMYTWHSLYALKRGSKLLFCFMQNYQDLQAVMVLSTEIKSNDYWLFTVYVVFVACA